PVLGDAVALREVLVNLVFNAVDAMPRGGDLTLAVHPAGAGAELIVRDTGQGMDPAVQRRIFEPFFTTKGEQGSGLGLAMVRKVIASLGGRVDVRSAPGVGTTFSIWLPTTDAPAEEVAPTAVGAGPARIARIVLVDDQRDVLDTTATLLRADGHDVPLLPEPAAGAGPLRGDRP